MSGQHILLVEDDPAVARGLVRALEEEGYRVTWHNRGEAGLAFASQAQPQLVIMDVRLPDGSGFDFCRRLRQMKLRQPVLMLTVQGDEVDRVLGLEMGADAYMTKPFRLRELLATIRALLRRAYGELSASGDGAITVGDLVVDLARGAVTRGGEVLNLTPTEFRLLVFLAQNRGQALSRAQILDAVWGYDDSAGERAVNVHIRRLREKVELDPSRPARILTVPGIGYRLAAGL